MSVSMPTGTVTFLFTDVVGSTRAWASDRLGMSASLRQHDEILRSVFESQRGYVFATGGDGFGVAFATASSAVEGCALVQQRLAEVAWAGPALQVRMGLHLGEAEERGGDYFGPVVNTAARIGAAAHGGQVVMSEQVRSAAGLQTESVDLGIIRLRDVPEPVHVHQLGAGAHPALRSAEQVDSTLPHVRTDLVGRSETLRDVGALLLDNRLVTLTAVGGAGKTRVALEVAHRALDEGTDAVYFADLSTIASDSEVGAAIASGLAFIPSPAGAVPPQVRDWIGDRPMLLVIDNCEHVVDEVAEQIDLLLATCPNVTVLATSREALDLEGEVVLRLEPLSTVSTPGELSPAVRLFRQRAADRGVALGDGDDDDLNVLNELCERLDGLPLAIELAAARTAALSPAQILTRLDDRFALLTSRRRRAAARQQTLGATIGWSFDLLEGDEQELLAHLSVFPAGFDLDGVEAVGRCDPSISLELIDSLIAKSLVQPAQHHRQRRLARYRLLETVRDFAHQQLARDPAALDGARDRYANHIAGQVTALAPWAFAPLSTDLELLADDLVPAIVIASAASDHGLVCRLASDAFPLWAFLGKHGDADAWIAEAEPHLDSRTLSQGLAARWGFSHWLPGRAHHAPHATRRAVECHPIEDQPWGWFTLLGHGLSQYIGHPEQAQQTLQEARSAIAWANHPEGATQAVNWLEGLMNLWTGDYARAVALYGVDQGLDQDDLLLAPFRLTGSLYANYLGDRHERNAELLDDAGIRRIREHWFSYGRRGAQNVLSVEVAAGIATAGLGDVDQATKLIKQAHDELGHTPWPRLPADFVLGVASLHLASDDPERARRALDAFALGRYPESQPLGYRLIAATNQWSPADWPARAVDEIRHRLTNHSEAQRDELANQLIATELRARS